MGLAGAETAKDKRKSAEMLTRVTQGGLRPCRGGKEACPAQPPTSPSSIPYHVPEQRQDRRRSANNRGGATRQKDVLQVPKVTYWPLEPNLRLIPHRAPLLTPPWQGILFFQTTHCPLSLLPPRAPMPPSLPSEMGNSTLSSALNPTRRTKAPPANTSDAGLISRRSKPLMLISTYSHSTKKATLGDRLAGFSHILDTGQCHGSTRT